MTDWWYGNAMWHCTVSVPNGLERPRRRAFHMKHIHNGLGFYAWGFERNIESRRASATFRTLPRCNRPPRRFEMTTGAPSAATISIEPAILKSCGKN